LIILALALSWCVGFLLGRVGSTGAIFVDNTTVDGNTFTTAASFGPTDYYLHNNPTPPTGDTNSQALLPLSTTSPTATILYNYSLNRDGEPGLMLRRTANGFDETAADKHQLWRSGALSEGLPIIGAVTIELWSHLKDFDLLKSGEVAISLRDYNGSTSTEIGNVTYYEALWQGGSSTWLKKTMTISGLNYTIPAGNELEIKLIVTSIGQKDICFAYDTTSYPSVVKIP